MLRSALFLSLMMPQLAFAWPTEDQWVAIDKDAEVLVDPETTGKLADVWGTEDLPVLSWYGEHDTVWLSIRVSTDSFDPINDVVGFGLRVDDEAHMVGVKNGVVYSESGSTPCDWSHTTLSVEETEHEVQITSGEDEGTLVTVAIPADYLKALLVVTTQPFELVGFQVAEDAGDWALDMSGLDEEGLWSCDDKWSDVVHLDSDEDGLFDPAEEWLGSDSNDADSDDDGRPDGEESLLDTDEDGVVGVLDCDSDDDGLKDGTEVGLVEGLEATDVTVGCFIADLDPSTTTDPDMWDSDGGGLSDGIEDWNFNGRVDEAEVDPTSSEDDADRDGDTIADAIEGTEKDTDEDGFKDYKDTDSDDDGILDEVEFLRDTDGDGDRDYVDTDSDGDTLSDGLDGVDDFDGDGDPNYRDIDSDDDGKGDEQEGRGDVDCDGMKNYVDPDDGPNCNDKAPVTSSDDFVPDDWDRTTSYREGHAVGGCATAHGSSKMFLTLAALALLLISRFRYAIVVLLWGATIGSAHAQSTSINAERFSPSLGNGDWTHLYSGEMLPEGSFLFNLSSSYARNPFVFNAANENTKSVPFLRDVFMSHISGGFSVGFMQLGIQAPIFIYSEGVLADNQRFLGDMRLSMGTGFEAKRHHMLFGLWVDGTLPTGDDGAGLGAGVPTLSTNLSIQWRKDEFQVLANAGFLTGTKAEILDLRVSPALLWGLGVNWNIVEKVRLGVELEGEAWLNNKMFGTQAQPGALPAEWAVVAGYKLRPDMQLNIGAGTRLGRGVGAPDVRGTMGLYWSPRLYNPEMNPAKIDTDGDGITDLKDACVEQAEDYNGVSDDDGCPDAGGLVTVLFEIVDVGGRLVAGARLDMVSGETLGGWLASDGTVRRALKAGRYVVSVNAEGFLPVKDYEILVPNAGKMSNRRHGIRIELIAPHEKSNLVLRIDDAEGKPVDNATVRVFGPNVDVTQLSTVDGVIHFPLRPGAYEVTITTPSGNVLRQSVNMQPGGTTDKTVVVASDKTNTQVSDGLTQLNMKVFFPYKQATLRPESYLVLDSLVGILNAKSEIRKVRINGHADAGRESEVAQSLSESRALAVYTYLVNAGVDPERLAQKGYGFSVPLQSGFTEEIHGTNRRVEFSILAFGE